MPPARTRCRLRRVLAWLAAEPWWPSCSVTTPAVKLFEDGGNPYANGKYYPTADTVDYIWNPAAATTGRLIGWVDHINVREAGGLVAALAG